MLTKSQILAAADLRTQAVPVPEWGGEVRVRLLTAAEREEITSIWTAHKSADDATKGTLTRDAMLLRCTVDADGRRLFDDADLPALKQKSAVAIGRVVDAAFELNAMAPDALETATKNSSADLTDASSSDSPVSSAAP
jgi:hypothetical protein